VNPKSFWIQGVAIHRPCALPGATHYGPARFQDGHGISNGRCFRRLRLPHVLHLTTSKNEVFCKSSFLFEKIKNEALLDFGSCVTKSEDRSVRGWWFTVTVCGCDACLNE
jgi:hypothetical protein